MKNSMKNNLLNEMEFYFGKDKRRIDHAREVLGFAGSILRHENGNGINKMVIIAAAVLHDIGVHACEKKYESTAGYFQEKEGPAIARHIMNKLNFEEKIIDEVCDIINNHHSRGRIKTRNFKVLYDAEKLANIAEEINMQDKNKLKKIINTAFFTNAGKEMARNRFLNNR